MSSLVCGLGAHKNSVYATVMSYSGELVEKRKLGNNEVVGYLGRYPVHAGLLKFKSTPGVSQP